MRALLIALVLTSGAIAQTAIVPLSAVCPPPQLTVAALQSTLGASAIIKLSCLKLDASVITDATTVPPTIKAVSTSVFNCPAGQIQIALDASTSSCALVSSSVSINTAVTPWTVTAIVANVGPTQFVVAPTSATSPCNLGMWSIDTTFYYVCVGSGSWKRVTISVW